LHACTSYRINAHRQAQFYPMNFPRTTAQIHTLPNGLTLILDPHHEHPVISAQLWVGTGSIHEGLHLGAGLSHFLEHMVFKGTASFSSERLASVVQAAGGHWNAYTSFDRTVYYIDGPASGLDVFLHVLTDMVFRPTLPESEFLLEKDVIRREIDMGLDDPHHAAMRLLLETAFRHDSRRQPVIGHRPAFDAIGHEHLVDYHRNRYTPQRSFVVLSGDFDTAHAIATIESLTADIVATAHHEPHLMQDAPQCSRREASATFAIPCSKVMVAWKIPQLGHADTPVYDLLAMMLGQGQSSKLYLSLREQRELAHELGAFTWNCHYGEGLLGICAECEPEKREALIEAALADVAAYANDELTTALARAKRQMMVAQFGSLTTASGRASDLASNWHEARDLHYTHRYLQAIDAVTEDDVRRCLSQLRDSQLLITQLNPLDAVADITQKAATATSKSAQTLRLGNGLEVAMFPDARLPLLSIQTVVRGGLCSENPAQNGITTLLASTLNEGTISRSGFEIASTLDGLGASLNASAGNNTITIGASCLAADLATVLEVWADVLQHPCFPADAVARDQQSQINSLREANEDPLSVCILTQRQLLFGNHGYGLSPNGTEDCVAKLTRDDLLAYHRKFFCAENMKIAIAGDFDAGAMIALLEKHLAAIPSGEAFIAAASTRNQARTQTVHRDKKQAVLALGFLGLAATDERRHACQMLVEYCSDMAGPLFTRIREELGLAYQVGATQFHGFHAGMLTFYLSTSPPQLELAHRELLAQLRKISEQGIPDDVFENVRATVLSALLLQQQSPGAIARHAATDLLYGLPATHHREVHSLILALTPDCLRQLAKSMLDHEPVTAIVCPEKIVD
jgi:zinc protease